MAGDGAGAGAGEGGVAENGLFGVVAGDFYVRVGAEDGEEDGGAFGVSVDEDGGGEVFAGDVEKAAAGGDGGGDGDGGAGFGGEGVGDGDVVGGDEARERGGGGQA
jgi:hypothetical protein